MELDYLQTEAIGHSVEGDVFAVPASSVQGRFWLIDQLSPGFAASNSPIVMRLTGTLDVASLESAINDLVRRHEALRTTFTVENSLLLQIIAAKLTIPLTVEDISSTAAGTRAEECRQLIQEHGSLRLNLVDGPLVYCKLIRLAPAEHVLAVTTHQIVCDGWSNGIFVRELALTYEAFAHGRPSPCEAPPLQYADFALWHNAWLQSEQAAQSRELWLGKLQGELLPLQLASDFPRRPGKVFPGAVAARLLPEPLMERMRHYARTHSTTLYVTLMAAFQILMKCYSRQDRFVLTSSCAGRSQPGLEETFGRFAHPQIILADLAGDPTFEALTGRVQAWCGDAWEHQDFPLEKILEAMGTEWEDFQGLELRAYFVFQKAFMQIHRLEALTLTPMPSVVGGASVDLGVGIVERAEGTRVHVEYNAELFRAGTIERLLANYETVLAAVVERPSAPVSTISVLAPAARERLLTEGNQTAVPYPRETCVQELVERQVEATPDAIALICGAERYTFAQLNARANAIAWYLRRQGLQPNDSVGVCLERFADMAAALLGILKAGGCYVPLDAAHPADRRAQILNESRAFALLTATRFARELEQAGHSLEAVRMICLDGEREASALARESPANPPLAVTAAHLAYVIYTSGSTGRPKGVQIPHRAFVNLLSAMRDLFHTGPASVLVAITTISFDIAGLELFLPLITGAQLVIATEEQVFDPGKLQQLLAASGATMLQATPDSWRMLMESGWQGDGELQMLCGGDALSRTLADALLERGGELWNMYGPTETTIWSSALRVTPGTGPVPIGGVLANTQFYVLNEQLQPVPEGVPGELCIGGDGVAQGYQNLPELTARHFVVNPFSAEPAARMYRTGDLVKRIPGGALEFLGRLDNQVKIRGFRIELGELESVLLQHPGVEAAAVVRAKSLQDEDCLAAYVTARRSARTPPPTAEELAALLRRKLAKHMQPASITLLDAIPVTASGKTDRKKLAETRAERTAHTSAYEPPRDAIQARLVEIWEKVLKTHGIGIRTSFFDLGGYSLTVVRLFAQINKTFDRNLPIATIFSAPTIEKLAEAIRGETVSRSLVPIQTAGRKDPLFAVHSYLLYSGMRQVLGDDRPLYGLQELEDDKGRVFRLEDRVENYVREIRSVQPDGPYHLIGWCAAGTLTLEVARALSDAGDEVALLGLIDAARPGYAAEAAAARQSGGWTARWRAKWEFHRSRLAPLDRRQKNAYLRDVARRTVWTPWRYLLLRYWKLIYRQCKRFGIAPPDFMHNVSWLTFASMQEHRIQPYSGSITLFRASDLPPMSDAGRKHDETLGWQDIALQAVEVIWVPGDHESMFREPNLAVFGARLQEALRRAGVQETGRAPLRATGSFG